MNGRCQKDALDRAEDICELCGNQYCAHCLLFPRGHRNPPTCKTCALQNSGLRGGSSKSGPISRREYKKRKKALLEQLDGVQEQEPAIDFLELKDPSPFDRSTELDRRPTVVEEPPVPVADDAPTSQPPNPGPPPRPDEATPTVAEQLPDELTPVDTSVNPLAVGGPPASTPSSPAASANPTPAPAPAAASAADANASAAELLARLKADQPITSQFSSTSGGLGTDPFATSTPTSDLVAQQTRPAAAPVPTPAAEPAATPEQPLSPPAATPVEQPPARPPTEQWSPPTPPPRGSNLAETTGGSAPAAAPSPAASEPAVPAPQPEQRPVSEPGPLPEAAPDQMSLRTSPFAGAPLPTPSQAQAEPIPGDASSLRRKADAEAIEGLRNSEPEQLAQTEPEPAELEPAGIDTAVDESRQKADTDHAGQWIPPSLRGMAEPEERAPLPKRR